MKAEQARLRGAKLMMIGLNQPIIQPIAETIVVTVVLATAQEHVSGSIDIANRYFNWILNQSGNLSLEKYSGKLIRIGMK